MPARQRLQESRNPITQSITTHYRVSGKGVSLGRAQYGLDWLTICIQHPSPLVLCVSLVTKACAVEYASIQSRSQCCPSPYHVLFRLFFEAVLGTPSAVAVSLTMEPVVARFRSDGFLLFPTRPCLSCLLPHCCRDFFWAAPLRFSSRLH